MAEVVLHEGRDEVVAVVVALLHAQAQGLAALPAGFGEALGLQLALEEGVARALVDEDRRRVLRRTHELRRVVAGPRFAIVAEVSAEGLLAPRDLGGGDDRRERRDRAVRARLAQREDERAVAAHGMAEDAPVRGAAGRKA